MPSYRILITTTGAGGQSRTFKKNVRAPRPEDAVDIACSALGLHRDLDRSEEPVGTWYSRAREIRLPARHSRRFGIVSQGTPPAATLVALTRA